MGAAKAPRMWLETLPGVFLLSHWACWCYETPEGGNAFSRRVFAEMFYHRPGRKGAGKMYTIIYWGYTSCQALCHTSLEGAGSSRPKLRSIRERSLDRLPILQGRQQPGKSVTICNNRTFQISRGQFFSHFLDRQICSHQKKENIFLNNGSTLGSLNPSHFHIEHFMTAI